MLAVTVTVRHVTLINSQTKCRFVEETHLFRCAQTKRLRASVLRTYRTSSSTSNEVRVYHGLLLHTPTTVGIGTKFTTFADCGTEERTA